MASSVGTGCQFGPAHGELWGLRRNLCEHESCIELATIEPGDRKRRRDANPLCLGDARPWTTSAEQNSICLDVR